MTPVVLFKFNPPGKEELTEYEVTVPVTVGVRAVMEIPTPRVKVELV